MTASSVELFPCQVQLMGLPRSTSGASTVPESATLEDISTGINRRPTIRKVQRVSRNLFGAPDPIEMKNLYKQEADRQRNYILERYNFDTKSSTDANEYNKNKIGTNKGDDINYRNSSFKNPTVIPNLIEQELKLHHESRLCNKQRFGQSSLEETPFKTNKSKYASCISKVKRRCEYITTLSPAVDHQKPYTRQSLLTERFNIRKSKICLSRNTKTYSAGVITTNNLEATRSLELPQLLENIACNLNQEETKPICKKACIERDKESNSALICKDTHTAVSLQLVVTAQNSS